MLHNARLWLQLWLQKLWEQKKNTERESERERERAHHPPSIGEKKGSIQQPRSRTFEYYYDSKERNKYINVQRKQFPLMPAHAMPLYSMQGTTADPGMVAYWFFPQRCSPTVKWLIVYVMLSRPRSLATLKSVGLTTKVREIIEQGLPEELVANFHKLFDARIKETKALAAPAAKRYNLLPGLI